MGIIEFNFVSIQEIATAKGTVVGREGDRFESIGVIMNSICTEVEDIGVGDCVTEALASLILHEWKN